MIRLFFPGALGLFIALASNAGAPDGPNCGCADAAPAEPTPVRAYHTRIPKPELTGILPIRGEMGRVHDPALAKDHGVYYLFSTGPGITVHTSRDLIDWQRAGRAFAKPIPWTSSQIPGSTDYYWAPDISFFNGRWHLYYSVSTFGKNRSAIGLATNTTLDPSRPDYHWRDESLVIDSSPADDWNAIDPNLAFDEHGMPWLAFGSFWSGIKLTRVDRDSGTILNKAIAIIPIAARPGSGESKGAIEAPYIVRHGKFFYLFASFDRCCRGVLSTYNVRVGRARQITGPYVDRDGKPMMEGGGTLVVKGAGRWRGTGHNAVYHEHGVDWLVYHAYDADDHGAPKLRIERLIWTGDGWPQAPSMSGEPESHS